MWIDRRLPSLRQRPVYGFIAAAAFVLIAAGLKLAMPGMQPFLTLYPAVLLSAFFGVRQAGIAALAVCTGLAIYFISTSHPGDTSPLWDIAAVIGFIIVCALILFIVNLLDQSIQRLEHERQSLKLERRRLELAFAAADMASWENLGMALHELATNTAKHGAFSTPTGHVSVSWGHVSVSWSLDGAPNARLFTSRWEESGGPKVDDMVTAGFGSKVLEQLAPAALRGVASITRKAPGLVWELKAPQSGLVGNP